MADQPPPDMRIEKRVTQIAGGWCVEFTVLRTGDHSWLACVAYKLQDAVWIDVPRSRFTTDEAAAIGVSLQLAVEWLEG